MEAKPAPAKASPVRLPSPSIGRGAGGEGGPVATTAAPKPIHPSPIWTVAFSPDGKKLAVGSYKRVTVYDLADGKRVGQWVVSQDAVRAVTFSPDGKWLAAGGGVPGQSGVITVLDANTGKLVRTVTGHTDTVEAIAFSGNNLFSAGNDEALRVTDMASGKTISTLTEHVGRCLAVAIPTKTADPNGGLIFATGGADKLVKIWDAKWRRVVVNFDQSQGAVWSVAAFPRPGMFVAGGADGRVRVFGVYRPQEAKPTAGEPDSRGGYQEREFVAHEGGVYAVAPAPNDTFIATGGADDKVCLWNLGGGKLKEFPEAKADILSVAVSPDSTRIASASLDGEARVYDVAKGTLLYEFPNSAPKPGAVVAPDAAAILKLLPAKAGTGTGLTAKYYNGKELTGAPIVSKVDAGVDYDWQGASPMGVPADGFSARWDGFVEAPVDGEYAFSTLSDDGVRLKVNGKMAIDNWTPHGPTENVAAEKVPLKAGQRIPIQLEFFEDTGGATIRLYWAYAGQAKQVIPAARLYPMPEAKPAPTVKPAPAVKPVPNAKPVVSGKPVKK